MSTEMIKAQLDLLNDELNGGNQCQAEKLRVIVEILRAMADRLDDLEPPRRIRARVAPNRIDL